MQNQPGYVLLQNGTTKEFRASSPKMALKVVMRILNLRSLTGKAMKKAKAVAIFFGRKFRIIFPFRHQRSREEHKARRDEKRNNRPTIDRDNHHDIGRRQHDVRWSVAV
ncbi:MAG: hypothetical protein AAB484_00770 [Patescibacteria group bacterium]